MSAWYFLAALVVANVLVWLLIRWQKMRDGRMSKAQLDAWAAVLGVQQRSGESYRNYRERITADLRGDR